MQDFSRGAIWAFITGPTEEKNSGPAGTTGPGGGHLMEDLHGTSRDYSTPEQLTVVRQRPDQLECFRPSCIRRYFFGPGVTLKGKTLYFRGLYL